MRKDLGVILQLGFAFLTIFSAFNSQGFLEINILRSLAKEQPSTGITENSGYYSLSIIYFVFTFSNIFAPPIIRKIGSKYSQILGACCYTCFLLSFLHLNAFLLYLSSAILGFGAAILWTGNGVFLVEYSREGKLNRNSGIMWAMIQGSMIVGGIFLLFVLSNSDMVSSYKLIYSVFSALSIVGVITLALLPSNPQDGYVPVNAVDQLVSDDIDEGVDDLDSLPEMNAPQLPQAVSFVQEMQNTLRILKTREMAALTVVFMYSGAETTFYTGVYSACLGATTALKTKMGSDALIPLNAFAMGAGQIVGGLTFGIANVDRKINRSQIIILGTILHILAFFLAFLNLPMESPLHSTDASGYIEPSIFIALLTGLLLGLADSCWNTQLYTALGEMYKNDSAAAFSIFKFFQSMASCISFYYGSLLLLHWQLAILWLGVGAAALSFFFVENTIEQRSIEIM